MTVMLGPIEAIPKGEGRAFVLRQARLAVFRDRDGNVYATQAECPHRGGPLADGLLGAGTLICPLHSLKFDLRTGLSSGSVCALRVYPARLDERGQVLVDVDELEAAP